MRRKKSLGEKGAKRIVLMVLILFLVIFLVTVFRIITNSIFFQDKDQVHLVSYGPKTAFFSFGLKDNTNYGVHFAPDIRVDVPGGYGGYRVGALGKLVSLEKNPELLVKTFSLATGTFVDFYLIPDSAEIYYGATNEPPALPTLRSVFFSKSNMNMFERIYVAGLLLQRGAGRITSLSYTPSFTQDYQGFFFEETFRRERLNVQIIYSESYETAVGIAQLIEGQGIRAGDITLKKLEGGCTVAEEAREPSYTARALAQFFNCGLKSGKTGGYDILFMLGEREREWYLLR